MNCNIRHPTSNIRSPLGSGTRRYRAHGAGGAGGAGTRTARGRLTEPVVPAPNHEPRITASHASRFTRYASRVLPPTGYGVLDTWAIGPQRLTSYFREQARVGTGEQARVRGRDQLGLGGADQVVPEREYPPYSDRVPAVLRARTQRTQHRHPLGSHYRTHQWDCVSGLWSNASRFTRCKARGPLHAARPRLSDANHEPRITVSLPAGRGQSVTWKLENCREEGNREQYSVTSNE